MKRYYSFSYYRTSCNYTVSKTNHLGWQKMNRTTIIPKAILFKVVKGPHLHMDIFSREINGIGPGGRIVLTLPVRFYVKKNKRNTYSSID